jgi:glutaredoxin-like protein
MNLEASPVIVYWRPGCPYCHGLLSGLRRTGIPFHTVNIWEDPEGAAVVRSIARGNETVPTVRIGEAGMVNPSVRQVIDQLRSVAPDLVADLPGKTARWRRSGRQP